MAKKTKAKEAEAEIQYFNLLDDKYESSASSDSILDAEPIKAKRLTHFDIIKMMFTDKDAFDNLTNAVLDQNFFMINRTFSIKYPLQAQYFNTLNVNGADVIRFWRQFLVAKEGYGREPKFIYTPGAKKQGATKVKTRAEELDKDAIYTYCKRHRFSMKDFKDMLYFFNDDVVEEVERIEREMKAKMFEKEKNKK